jgi:hypothetical protein
LKKVVPSSKRTWEETVTERLWKQAEELTNDPENIDEKFSL